MIAGFAAAFMALGLVGVLRAVGIVTTGRDGRARFDPWVSLVVGFGFILLGQALLRHQ
jgi:hypothetical protein